MGMDDVETRLLAVGTVGWFLAGLLTAILIKKKYSDKQTKNLCKKLKGEE